jgi:hypothetical protein
MVTNRYCFIDVVGPHFTDLLELLPRSYLAYGNGTNLTGGGCCGGGGGGHAVQAHQARSRGI